MQNFVLERDYDVSGVSGTGRVAEGVVFTNGRAVMTWLTEYSSIAIYNSIEELVQIHSHGGATRVVWLAEAGAKKVGSSTPHPPFNRRTLFQKFFSIFHPS